MTAPTLALQAITKSVEKIAPDRVRITLTTPRPDLAWLFSSNAEDVYGAIIPMDYWNKVGVAGFEKAPMLAGPFKVVSIRPDAEMVLERFEDYYYQPKFGSPEDRRPKFQRFVLRVVPEAATRAAAIAAGQADLIQANLFMIKDIEKARGKVVYAPQSSFTWVRYLDCWDAKLWCNKKEARQALEYAVDKQALIKQIYGPEIAVQKGWAMVSPDALGYLPGVTDPFPYDVEKARQLLAKAGFPNGKGIPPIKVYTWEAGDLPLVPQLATAVASMWKKNLGLDVQVVVGDGPALRAAHGERQLAGHMMIRTNESRFDALRVISQNYVDQTANLRSCTNVDSQCQRLANVVNEKMLPAVDLPTMTAIWTLELN